jgi:invasion protein IalB
MKRFVFAVLAVLTLAIAAAPAASAATATDEPGSGTLTWAVPTIGE